MSTEREEGEPVRRRRLDLRLCEAGEGEWNCLCEAGEGEQNRLCEAGLPYSQKRKTLPVWQRKQQFMDVLAKNQTLILVGETSSGKTTQELLSRRTILSISELRVEEATVSTLWRMVMLIWMFLLMVVTSSYTANLTSILTVRQLALPIQGIDSLIASHGPIGYRVGSFSKSYLVDSLNIPESRLVPLSSPQDYDRALNLRPNNGGVGIIVDELPYVELFLSKQTEFSIVGRMFTKSGWGFVGFPQRFSVSS